MVKRFIRVAFSVLLAASWLSPGLCHADAGQSDIPPFQRLMALAAVKRLLVVDTVAGKTHVLLTSATENPELVIVHAMGGEGNPLFTGTDGLPGCSTSRSGALG